ncbi:MAG: hypothetical protein GY757_30785 [bacterium]|nr:hypothetical protein [bacterium]
MENLEPLLAQKHNLVPFIGAGFSMPACPGWGDFLRDFFHNIKNEFLDENGENHFLQLMNGSEPNRLEKMAAFLVTHSGRRRFEEEIKTHFSKPLTPGMVSKFESLHRVFTGLKITTNYDNLIEENAPSNVTLRYGNEADKLEQLFTKKEINSLLKIHGGLLDPGSIVLSSQQYEAWGIKGTGK